jgi:predicted glycoside hydrolase/deacetylase ChbG (UPF0249 family)
MKYLIVNADDYAMTMGVNQGIIEGHLQGIVTSTTVMATGAALSDGLARLADAPRLATGCHLVLIGDQPLAPLAQIRSLVTANGGFPRTLTAFLQQITWQKIVLSEIIIEFRTQIEHLLNRGLKLSHLDTHKHSHAHPQVLEAILTVAQEYRIPYIRNPFERGYWRQAHKVYRQTNQASVWRQYFLNKTLFYYRQRFQRQMQHTTIQCPQHFHGFLTTGNLCAAVMPLLFAQMPIGINELMCHPARLDTSLLASNSRLKNAREQELLGLTSINTRQALQQAQITLTSFRDLATVQR